MKFGVEGIRVKDLEKLVSKMDVALERKEEVTAIL